MSRDKRLIRDAFARNNVSSPASVLALTYTDIFAAAREIGFPAVIKPRKLAGSIGVVLAKAEQALLAAIVARQASEKQVCTRSAFMNETPVEAYVDGPGISVEIVVVALPQDVTSQLIVEAATGRALKVLPQASLDRAAFIITQADTACACRAASTAHLLGTRVILK